jgi:hypothetical protein
MSKGKGKSKGKGWLALLALVLSVQSLAREAPPEVDKHGLHLVHHSELKIVYKLPEADLSRYSKVVLSDARVAFERHWEREHKGLGAFHVSASEIKQIKTRVAEEFRKVFTEELEKLGYEVLDEAPATPELLAIAPAIINLDIEAPDPMHDAGMTRVVAASAGSMTLYAELYDAVSSQLVAWVADPQADRGFGGAAIAMTRGTNQLAEDRIVRLWAQGLAKQLHETVSAAP